VFARRFDASATPLGGEFLVAGGASNEQVATDVAIDATGASPWSGIPSACRLSDISSTRAGTTRPAGQGSEYILDTGDTSLLQSGGAISLDSRGGFVVVWGCDPAVRG
jgi:hypothetical protein